MKFLAIEREIDGADFENAQSILKDEAKYVLKLQNDDYIREIYFTEDHNAVLILECKDIEEAIKILNELPLVKNNMITFDVSALLPYTGFNRLIAA